MANSQDINYALISALYASRTKGLYSDVYFPIIKYTLIQLFKQKASSGGSTYYTAQDVHVFIEGRFKIHIPTIVITKSLEKIEMTKKSFVELTLMEHGNSFQIRRLWDSQEFDELADREAHFSKGLKSIEEEYRLFLKKNGTFDDGVSYLQFISDNTEEVLGYFQNNDTSVIDEKYTTIIFFLEYLHQTPSKKDEFLIADQLFWASIIAGYLRSEKPSVDAADDGRLKEYFLDTSILLGMLNLSSRQKERYSAEIRDIIKESGGVMRVHPMTLEEIRIILGSVENSARPDFGSDIAEAWENHQLSITKLASIRLNLQELLAGQGVQLFPILGADTCRRVAQSYRGKKIIAELALERNPRSYSQDNFREIHDLFMDDYIRERRRDMGGSEDIVFVTANRDLISFTKNLHPEANYMMSTGRVVLDLWMHSAKPANISGCALTETMARCLDQHNMRVRNKIVEVSKFFNENKGNFDAKVYQDFIKKLYRRAQNVIMTVETNPDNQDTLGELTAQRILDAVKADQEYSDRQVIAAESNKTELAEQLEREKQEKERLAENNKAHREQIDGLSQEKSALLERVASAQEMISERDRQLEEERANRSAAEIKASLYEEKEDLRKVLGRIDAELVSFIKQRGRSFSNFGMVLLFVLGIALIVGAVVVTWYSINKGQYWNCLISVLVPLGIWFLSIAREMNKHTEERRAKAYNKWEQKPENKKYRLFMEEKQIAENRLSEIDNLLNASKVTKCDSAV